MEDILNVLLDSLKDKSPQLSIKNLLPATDEAHLNGVMMAVTFWRMLQGCGRRSAIF